MKKVAIWGIAFYILLSVAVCLTLSSCNNPFEIKTDASLNLDLSPLIAARGADDAFDNDTSEQFLYLKLNAHSAYTTTSTYYYNYAPDLITIDTSTIDNNTYEISIPNVPLQTELDVSIAIYYDESEEEVFLAASGSGSAIVTDNTIIPITMKMQPRLLSVELSSSTNTTVLLDTQYNGTAYAWSGLNFAWPTLTAYYSNNTKKEIQTSEENATLTEDGVEITTLTTCGVHKLTITYAGMPVSVTYNAYILDPSTVELYGSKFTDYLDDGADFTKDDSVSGTVTNPTIEVEANDYSFEFNYSLLQDDTTPVDGTELTVSEDTDIPTFSISNPIKAKYTLNQTLSIIINNAKCTQTIPLKTITVCDTVATEVIIDTSQLDYFIRNNESDSWTKGEERITSEYTLSLPTASIMYSNGNYDKGIKVPAENITYNNGSAYAAPTTAGNTTYTITYGKAKAEYTVYTHKFASPTYTTGTTSSTFVPITFTADSTTNPGAIYTWSVSGKEYGEGTDSTFTFTPTEAGTDTVSLSMSETTNNNTYTLTFTPISLTVDSNATITIANGQSAAKTVELSFSSEYSDASSSVLYSNTDSLTFTAQYSAYNYNSTETYTWYFNGVELTGDVFNTVKADATVIMTCTPAQLSAAAQSVVNLSGKNTLTVVIKEGSLITAQASITMYFTTNAQ